MRLEPFSSFRTDVGLDRPWLHLIGFCAPLRPKQQHFHPTYTHPTHLTPLQEQSLDIEPHLSTLRQPSRRYPHIHSFGLQNSKSSIPPRSFPLIVRQLDLEPHNIPRPALSFLPSPPPTSPQAYSVRAFVQYDSPWFHGKTLDKTLLMPNTSGSACPP